MSEASKEPGTERLERFAFFKKYARVLDKLEDADCGKIMHAIIDYVFYGIEPNLDYPLGATFEGLRDHLDKSISLSHPNDNAAAPDGTGQNQMEPKEVEVEVEVEEKKKGKKKKPTPPKHAYGQFQNVMLTDDELAKLREKYPDADKRIDDLSYYMGSKGVSYKDHYRTILSWARKEEERGRASPQPGGAVDDFWGAA